MPIGKKIRIYDLARDLKQDAKRVMEDLRREGADVSVPSNSVSLELAEKVRLKYFPKTEVAPKRAIKIIKASKKSEAEAAGEELPQEITETPDAPPVEVVEAVEETPVVVAPVIEVPIPEKAEAPASTQKRLARKKIEEPVVAEPVEEVEVVEAPVELEQVEVEAETPAEAQAETTS